MFVVFGVCTSGELDQSGLNSLFRAVFDEKVWIMKYLARIFDKKIKWKKSTIVYLSSEIKSTTLFQKVLTNFSKIGKILVENSGKCE